MLKTCPTFKPKNSLALNNSRQQADVHSICDSVKTTQTHLDQTETESRVSPLVNLRYVQQLLAKYNIQKHKTSYCCNRQFSTSSPTLLLNNQKTTNIFHCKHSSCSVCSKKIYQDKNNQLRKVFHYVAKNNPKACFHMLTLTIPHNQFHKLDDRMRMLAAMKRALMNHKVIKDLDLLFFHSTLEIVYSKNGFHPHYHIMLSKIKELTQQQIQAIANQYQKIAKKFNIIVNIVKSFTITSYNNSTIDKAANYLSKSQDFSNLANELVSDNKKYSSNETYSMFQLISLAANNQFDKIVYSKSRVENIIIEYLQLKNINYFRGCKKYDALVKLSANIQLANSKNDPKPTKYIQINPKAFLALSQNNLLLASEKVDQNNNVVQFEGLLKEHRRNLDLNDTYAYILYLLEANQKSLYPGIENDISLHNVANDQLPFQDLSFSYAQSSPSVSFQSSQLAAA
jgi:hypothetical protein